MSLETKFKTEQRTEHQDSTLNNTKKPKSQFDKNKFQPKPQKHTVQLQQKTTKEGLKSSKLKHM